MKLEPLSFLFMEGDPGDRMFIIRRGRIRIMKREGSQMATLAELGPGSILGEMSLLDRQPRSATAKTLETTELLVIDQNMLEKTYEALPPWLTSIIRMLVQRLRETTARKYRDDLFNAFPCLLFLLQDSKEPLIIMNLADQMRSLYGLSYSDFQRLLSAFQKMGLTRLLGDDRIEVINPRTSRLLYLALLDRTLPKPTRENLLSKEETQSISALLSTSAKFPQVHDKLNMVTQRQILDLYPDLQCHHLANLCLAGHLQGIPEIHESGSPPETQRYAFDEKRIQELLDLQRLFEKATSGLAEFMV